jgi:hypothetical protein
MTTIEIKYAELDEGFGPDLSTITIAGGSEYEQPIWRSKADKVRAEGRKKGWSFTIEGKPFGFDDQDARVRLLKLPCIPESHKGENADGTPLAIIVDAPR